MTSKLKLKKVEKPTMTVAEKWCNSYLVTYPVSYRYNGGIIIDDEWYNGYDVPKPKVPKGFKITSIGIGLQLNARPPYATVYMEPIDRKSITKRELKAILAAI